MWTKQLKIDGMTCPTCATAIEDKLKLMIKATKSQKLTISKSPLTLQITISNYI